MMNGYGASKPKDECLSFHVIPEGDIAEHVDSPACWCQPIFDGRDLMSGNEVWIHRRALEEPQ